MAGVTNIQIEESEAELEALLKQSQNLKDKQRLLIPQRAIARPARHCAIA